MLMEIIIKILTYSCVGDSLTGIFKSLGSINVELSGWQK